MERATAAKHGVLAVALAAIAAHPAFAIQQVKSLYTAIDLRSCRMLAAKGGGNAWLCDGLPDYPVYVAEANNKTYLSVGANAAAMRAARQTLASFNGLFEGGTTRPAVEWRFIIRNGKPVPYATIVRYATEDASGRGEVLIVTRVSAGEVCHVAYIDALANSDDALILARRVADERARAFSCASEPMVMGARGKSPM